jgi:hypothetical protein
MMSYAHPHGLEYAVVRTAWPANSDASSRAERRAWPAIDARIRAQLGKRYVWGGQVVRVEDRDCSSPGRRQQASSKCSREIAPSRTKPVS